MKFSRSIPIPDYLEEALAPFYWSSILSNDFRSTIVSCILTENRKEVIPDFLKTLDLIQFLSSEWKAQLSTALLRFAEEGFTKGH